MAYQALYGEPTSENFQDNFNNGMHAANGWNFRPRAPWPLNPSTFGEKKYHDIGHRRTAPAEPAFVEYDRVHKGWYQGDRRMPRDSKPNKYWARPVDGKRRGAMGRLLDGLTGEGPSVFVVVNGDRRTLMRDMPHKAQWSRWEGPKWDINWDKWDWDKDATQGEDVHMDVPWATQGRGRYNFRTRRYEGGAERQRHHMQNRLWTDAHWAPDAGRYDADPLSFRTGPREYTSRVDPWDREYPGGRPLV
ncbi:hypothetical protein LTR08_009304 [Meristemomyces frigidus]|nr:hypothetical protein LTR08_009304 [Meristemomyces frigidus]